MCVTGIYGASNVAGPLPGSDQGSSGTDCGGLWHGAAGWRPCGEDQGRAEAELGCRSLIALPRTQHFFLSQVAAGVWQVEQDWLLEASVPGDRWRHGRGAPEASLPSSGD